MQLLDRLRNALDPASNYDHAPGDPPLRIRMDITNKCNLLCKMCFYPGTVGDPKFDMDLDLVRKIVDEVFPHAGQAVLSCQYEPFMSRNIEEVLQIVAEGKCPRIGFVSNGTLWSERRIRLMLACKPLETVAVSIDGGTKATYERIRVNGNFDKLVRNLEMFKHLRDTEGDGVHPGLQLNVVLMKSNVAELVEIVALGARVGAGRIEAIRFLPINSQLDEAIDDWEPYMPTLLEARRLAHEHSIELMLPIEDERLAAAQLETKQEAQANHACIGRFSQYCEAPWSAVQIYPDGTIHPCGYYGQAFGNLKEQSFLEIWNSAPYRELRRSLTRLRLHSPCAKCNPHGYDNIERKRRINAA